MYLFPDNEIFAVIIDQHGRTVQNKVHARFVRIPSINVLPQVRPFLIDEEPRDEAYEIIPYDRSIALAFQEIS